MNLNTELFFRIRRPYLPLARDWLDHNSAKLFALDKAKVLFNFQYPTPTRNGSIISYHDLPEEILFSDALHSEFFDWMTMSVPPVATASEIISRQMFFRALNPYRPRHPRYSREKKHKQKLTNILRSFLRGEF